MKNSRILKIFSIAVILSLLMLAIPVLPDLAAESHRAQSFIGKSWRSSELHGKRIRSGSGSINCIFDIYISTK